MKFREADKILRQNGWSVRRIKGSHYHYAHDDFGYVVTLIVHGHSAELSPSIISSLQKSTGIFFNRKH